MDLHNKIQHQFDLATATVFEGETLDRSAFFAEEPADDGSFDSAGTLGTWGTAGGSFGTVGTFGCCC